MGRGILVSSIKIEMVADGHCLVVCFTRPEKLADLLCEDGTLGEFLRDLRATTPPPKDEPIN